MNPLPISFDSMSSILNRRIVFAERASTSGNSRVYRIRVQDGADYAAKFYLQPTVQGRSRLDVEFSGLEFMWNAGVRCVPRPFVADRAHHVAVYEFVEGSTVPAATATLTDVAEIVRFATELKSLSMRPGAESLASAAEACFSVGAIVANIEARLDRLQSARAQGPAAKALSDYLSGEFVPALETLKLWADGRAGDAGLARELEPSARTLSPSDFGFHNALRRSNGALVFLDFEYFGWDDPAKMIADFLLHPAMELGDQVKNAFVRQMLDLFTADPDLGVRLATVYPLFGLKWCMIMLNEFIPRDLARREFAASTPVDRLAAQARQLAKSKTLLRKIMSGFEHFPYLAHAA
jgi:hypothetical protein